MTAERRSPPPDWRHGGPLPEEAPHRRERKLRDDPEVRALVDELSQGLKPGEDPLFYEMPEEPDDPEACAPNEARVYVGPVAPPQAHHETLEMARVKVAPEVDPRRAMTERVQARRPPDAREDAPPMSGPASTGPASAGPASTAGRKKTALVLALGALAVALVVLAAIRAPKTTEKPAASETAAAMDSAIPSATAATAAARTPSATVIPTAAATATMATSAGPSPVRPQAVSVRPAKSADPHDAAPPPPAPPPATAAPAPTPTAAPAEPPPPPPPPLPKKPLSEAQPTY